MKSQLASAADRAPRRTPGPRRARRLRSALRGLIRRREGAARVRIVGRPESHVDPSGGVTTRQVADVTVRRADLDRIWNPEHLERLGRTYWRFLTRVSLGVLRVHYTPGSREVVVVGRPLVLLRFHAPDYEMEQTRGSLTWRIDRGLLVSPRGRGEGFLRITVERRAAPRDDEAVVRVSSEVANFYPTLRGSGWFERIGNLIYRVTQLRLHVTVTNAYLRSLRRLDLPPSVVGALRGAGADAPAAGLTRTAGERRPSGDPPHAAPG